MQLLLHIKPPKSTTSESFFIASRLAAPLTHSPVRVTSNLMFPFKEDLIRYDFEVASEDEHLCEFGVRE